MTVFFFSFFLIRLLNKIGRIHIHTSFASKTVTHGAKQPVLHDETKSMHANNNYTWFCMDLSAIEAVVVPVPAQL